MASAAAAPATDAAPKKGGKKKLLLIVGIVLVLLLAGGGGALFMMKKAADKAAAEAAAADEDGEERPAGKAAAKVDPAKPPAFVPLEPFVVNLADRDSDRFAQIGITLEVDDPGFAEKMKPFMPAIRNNILMILAHKSSTDLVGREGKEKLAEEIAREAVRPMGIEIDPPEAETEEEPPKKKRKKSAPPHNPVRAVLFSSFIVQ